MIRYSDGLMLVLVALALAGCSRTWDQKKVEEKVADMWRHCQIVIPQKVTIEEQNSKMIRYSYVLKMRAPGEHADRSYPCYKPDQKLIEAFANKDMHQIKKDEEILIIQEISK